MDILERNLLVLASAGSGKTYCLSDRIIGLMASGVLPQKIVALTFTRKAAGEFADAILSKLADAATDPAKAAELHAKCKSSDTDFTALLETTVRNLPKLTLGTMDSFFSKIVKSFQYELGLTGGNFELLEGEVAEAVRDELMETLLDAGPSPDAEDDFVEIFRKATAGSEGVEVLKDLRDFIRIWHKHFASAEKPEWGPARLAGVDQFEWDKRKAELIAAIRGDWPNVVTNDKRQQNAFEVMMNLLESHTIGSGSFQNANSLLSSVITAVSAKGESLDVKAWKNFTITGIAAQCLRELLELAARCEFAAALSRTRGIHEVIAFYDLLIERELRGKGKLGFDDVKRLMGAWMNNEDARLMREAVDFRLDANYHHWLLDEFQDTSRDEWNALLPLIDEGITDDESTVFVVGDKKQAIYAWRGGEVGLFDELIRNYGSGIKVESMADSWRSCPEVLDLVNRVCGDHTTMAELFGDAANDWPWEEHVSAKKLTAPDKAGHARVEIVPKEEKTERVVQLLRELGIGEKQLSCGILVPKNDRVTEWADTLREAGFQVIEEGAREPAKDHPVGVMIWQLLRWLADPSDGFAEQAVLMSPMETVLRERFGNAWQDIWEGLSRMVSEHGFAEMVREITAPLIPTWREFGKRRAEDLLQALDKLDQSGVVLAKEAADRIGRMKISQSPGVAAVQLMTIHKSKGLGFDVVILPDVPDEKIPSFTHYKTVEAEGWISDAPASWVREIITELKAAENAWSRQQTYEAFCKLYVALTRAKRGLYVFLNEKPPKSETAGPTLTNWIAGSLELDRKSHDVFESGSAQWHTNISSIEQKSESAPAALGQAIAKRPRTTASAEKKSTPSSGFSGRSFGIAVHHAFEQIGWLDEDTLPVFPHEIANLLGKNLQVPAIRNLLSKSGRTIQLLREQRIEAITNGKWLSGVIDRLHIHQNDSGETTKVEIIDFKTDRVADANELSERYASQLEAYRSAMQKIYPAAEIQCLLLSTSLGEIVHSV